MYYSVAVGMHKIRRDVVQNVISIQQVVHYFGRFSFPGENSSMASAYVRNFTHRVEYWLRYLSYFYGIFTI